MFAVFPTFEKHQSMDKSDILQSSPDKNKYMTRLKCVTSNGLLTGQGGGGLVGGSGRGLGTAEVRELFLGPREAKNPDGGGGACF